MTSAHILEWNGTYIGSYTSDIIQSCKESKPYNIYTLNVYPYGNIYCSMKKSKTLYPCIVDEIKHVLTFVKIGTHSLHINGHLHIIYNIRNGVLITEYNVPIHLSEVLFKQAVQDIYVFKMVLGCGYMDTGSIIVINNIPSAYKIALSSIYMDVDNIPECAIKRWFVDEACNSVSRMMRRHERTSIIREKILDIIKSIDKSYLWLEPMIIDKITKIG